MELGFGITINTLWPLQRPSIVIQKFQTLSNCSLECKRYNIRLLLRTKEACKTRDVMIRKHFPPTTPSMASDPALVAGEGGGNIRAWLISGMWWRPRHAIRSVTFIVDARWWRIMNEHHLVGAGLYLFSFFMPKDKYFQYTSQGTLSIGPKAHTQCQEKS